MRRNTAKGGTKVGTGFTTADRIAAIKYRLRMGYPGSAGKAVRFDQAKADVATLLVEVENLRRAVDGFLTPATNAQLGVAPKNDNALKVAHGGDDERRDRKAHGADRG